MHYCFSNAFVLLPRVFSVGKGAVFLLEQGLFPFHLENQHRVPKSGEVLVGLSAIELEISSRPYVSTSVLSNIFNPQVPQT